MYLLHLRPLFVELPIFVPGGLVLLEPRDLVREQTCRSLRRGAADLRGGEEHGNGKVERDRKSTRLNSQSLTNLVCRLLLEKKNTYKQ